MRLVLTHERLGLGNGDHPVAMRVWNLTAEWLTATASGAGEMGHDEWGMTSAWQLRQ